MLIFLRRLAACAVTAGPVFSMCSVTRTDTLHVLTYLASAGKKYGVYRFQDKYGANVDGYSPIYTPDIWSESGEQYSLGTKGLLAWAGLIVVLLGVGINLVVSTSQLGQ